MRILSHLDTFYYNLRLNRFHGEFQGVGVIIVATKGHDKTKNNVVDLLGGILGIFQVSSLSTPCLFTEVIK